VGILAVAGHDGCKNIGIGLCGPHGAVAIGCFSPDPAAPRLSLQAVACRLALAGIIAKGQKLFSRPRHFSLQLERQVAVRCVIK
jgi:hypothetical protein